MKRYFNTGSYRVTLILILFLTCFTYKSNAQNIQVQATISKTTIPIGEQAILYISARVPQKTDVTFPVLADSIISKLQIVKTSKPDTSFDKSSPGEEIITRSYTLTSFDANLYVIPQYTIHTKAGDLKTNILTLQVTAVKVDTTKAVYDIKQPFAVSYNIFDWLKDNWLWVAIGLGIVLLIVGIVYYLKKRPKKEVIKKSVPVIPDHVIALNKLSELRDKKLWQQPMWCANTLKNGITLKRMSKLPTRFLKA
jgi:hypothetical protein